MNGLTKSIKHTAGFVTGTSRVVDDASTHGAQL